MSKESRNTDQNRAAFLQISSSNKSAAANRKAGFYANHDLNKQEVGFVFALSVKKIKNL